MSKPRGQRRFTLRAILLWLVHDFPAYGLLSGQQTKGYKGCPVCGEETVSEYSSILKKMIYLGGRRFLDLQHPSRNARQAFNGFVERAPTPVRQTGQEVYEKGMERERYLQEGGVQDAEDDPVKRHGVKRVSIFFRLPYWKDLPCRHTLDVMHVEKNICETLLKFILGDSDTMAVRVDMQGRRLRNHLWVRETFPGSGKYLMPNADYVLSEADKIIFFETLGALRMPSRYVSNIRRRIENGKLRGLKSHDYHVILHQILPVCVRNIENRELASAIIKLSRVFQRICDKVISMECRNQLLQDVAETMVLLEKQLPPSAFTIMMHLPYHLVQEVFMCGPVQNRWMYPFERYYKGLKSYVRNLAKPEGSMAASYELEEATGYMTEYLLNYNPTSRRVWDSQEDPTMVDEILEGQGRTSTLTEERRSLFHNFVIDTSGYCAEYQERYEELKSSRQEQRKVWRRRHPHRRGRRGLPYPDNLVEFSSFAKWLEEEIEYGERAGIEIPQILKDISIPPKYECKKFRSMWAFGNRFRVASYESKLETRDSGVVATFSRPWRSSARDRNVIEVDLGYVGELEEIVELDYCGTCVVVFVYRWVAARYRGPNATVKKDKWGFTIANFQSCESFGKESFVFPKHCDQGFFSDAPELPGWRVVLRREVRGKRVDNSTGGSENVFLFDRGLDAEHEGLRPPPVIPEDIERQQRPCREVRREDVFHEADATNELLDADLGDSSASDS